MSTATRTPARPGTATEVTRRRSARRCVADVWQFRELLVNLTRKELKLKYKNSVLGFVWSLLNPLLYLIVFYVVFTYFLPNGLPHFVIFLLAGLLPWTLYSTGLGGGTASVVGNAALVKKVWFPREILPLASIGAALVHFALQLTVLVAALVAFRSAPAWEYLPLLIPALVALVVLAAALAIGLSAINVYLRDTQHLLELVLLAWFWMTPIVYTFSGAYGRVVEKAGDWSWLYWLNPVTSIVITFQRAIYGRTKVPVNGTMTSVLPDEPVWWYLRNVGIVFGVSLVLLWLGFVLFAKLEDNFAEEL